MKDALHGAIDFMFEEETQEHGWPIMAALFVGLISTQVDAKDWFAPVMMIYTWFAAGIYTGGIFK